MVVALALTACSHPSHRPQASPVAAETSPAPEPLTPETAAKAFRAFVTNDDVARSSGDERLGLWWTSEGQSQLTASAFRVATAAGDPVPRYRYDSPELYVPKLLPDGMQWFVAKVRRTTLDGKDPQTAIMGFVRSRPNQRWRLSLSTLLDRKQKLPRLAVDSAGYAKPLATFDRDLLIPPRLVPSIQATLAEEGPQNVAAKVMATGKYTTSYYTSDQKHALARKADGLRATAVYATTGYPIFPLATADGDAVVLYALSRNAVLSKLSKKRLARVPIPKEAAPFVDPRHVHGILELTQMMQFIAVVPAKPKKDGVGPKAEIIGSDGATISALTPSH